MTRPTPIGDESYKAVPAVPRLWGLSRGVWLLVAGFCAFAEFAAAFATNGRMGGWGDVVFVLVFAWVGVVAFINAVRLLWRAE
jgi:hypothetical protein